MLMSNKLMRNEYLALFSQMTCKPFTNSLLMMTYMLNFSKGIASISSPAGHADALQQSVEVKRQAS